MSHQTCILEYFKPVSSKRKSDMTDVKEYPKLKKTLYSKSGANRRKLSQPIEKSNSLSNSTNAYSEINKILDSNEIMDKELFQHETSHMRLQIINDKGGKVNEKLSDDVIYLETVKKENSLFINPILSSNKSIQLKEISERKLNVDSSLTAIKLTPTINDSHLKMSPNKEQRTPNKSNSPRIDSSSSGFRFKKLDYSPKLLSDKPLRNISIDIFDYTIDSATIIQAVKHMNLIKQGVIPPNNFKLEEIYSKGIFNYNHVSAETSMKYKLNEIVLPSDLDSKILFGAIFIVFSNPLNCGYFDKDELDFIYSIITLPTSAQKLLMHMIKRKRTWHRKSSINYPEIATDLKNVFEVLVSRDICTFDIKDEDLYIMLKLLQVKEISSLCRIMNINNNKTKQHNIPELIKLSKKKSLFPGMQSPCRILYSHAHDMLEYCVQLTNKTWNFIDRVITLLIPNQDPLKNTADTFFMLSNIYSGKVIYPSVPKNRLPIFESQLHLIRYIKYKDILSKILQCIEKKNWTEVQNYGNIAMDKLPKLLEMESSRLKDSLIPVHIRHYRPVYMCLKILSKCVEAFKKDKDKTRVLEVLRILLKQNYYLHTKRGRWYAELACIHMYHHKNVEESALVIKQALSIEKNLTRVDKVELIERANKILKRKTGVEKQTKICMSTILNNYVHEIPKDVTTSNTINAVSKSKSAAGSKTMWCIENNIKDQSYGSVELLALHYYHERGFSNGLHCESELPIILFCTLFWEELYDTDIPGVFVTSYQDAPSDLFTEQFYENRKEKIDLKFEVISNSDLISLSTRVEQRFKIYRQYQSIMSSNLLRDSLQLKEIVQCLGIQGVAGICKRLIENFQLWKAGFPDLIVWNFNTKKYKIVEVKGPRDTLSVKQRLWLEYLQQLGLDTEVCLVRGK